MELFQYLRQGFILFLLCHSNIRVVRFLVYRICNCGSGNCEIVYEVVTLLARFHYLITAVMLDGRISRVPRALQPLQQVFILKSLVTVSLAASASITPLAAPRTCICLRCGSSCFKTAAELTGRRRRGQDAAWMLQEIQTNRRPAVPREPQ